MAAQMGRERLGIEHVTVNARERFPALIERRTDIHCGPASATLQRRETLDFSILYFVDGAGIASRPQSYQQVFESGGGTFGVVGGTTTMAVAEDLIARNGLDGEILIFPSHDKGLAALADGTVDLYFGDQAILLFQIEAAGLAEQIGVREDVLSFEPYALVMRRGETALRLAVDRALSAIYEDGGIYRLIRKELGDYPLSPEARAVYEIVGMPE